MEQVQQQNLPHAVKVVFGDRYQDSFLLDIPFDKDYVWLNILHCLENNVLRLYIRYVSRVQLDTLDIHYSGPPYTELVVPFPNYPNMEVFSSIRVTVFVFKEEESGGVWKQVEEGITINV